jgi:hypothetical protein
MLHGSEHLPKVRQRGIHLAGAGKNGGSLVASSSGFIRSSPWEGHESRIRDCIPKHSCLSFPLCLVISLEPVEDPFNVRLDSRVHSSRILAPEQNGNASRNTAGNEGYLLVGCSVRPAPRPMPKPLQTAIIERHLIPQRST